MSATVVVTGRYAEPCVLSKCRPFPDCDFGSDLSGTQISYSTTASAMSTSCRKLDPERSLPTVIAPPASAGGALPSRSVGMPPGLFSGSTIVRATGRREPSPRQSGLKLHSGDVDQRHLARCLASPQVSVMWLVIRVCGRHPHLSSHRRLNRPPLGIQPPRPVRCRAQGDVRRNPTARPALCALNSPTPKATSGRAPVTPTFAKREPLAK
ncbi:MAG: hypothetical protein JWR34_1735 [Mycobacterium sp.]|nr:hypothetical protein [Mycobacterium sp.]